MGKKAWIVVLIVLAFLIGAGLWIYSQSKIRADDIAEPVSAKLNLVVGAQQSLAIDSLKFGASKAEFLKAFPEATIQIKGVPYKVAPSFDDRLGLFRIKIKSQPQPGDAYRGVEDKMYVLLDYFGAKAFSTPECLSCADLWYQRPNAIMFKYNWSVGKKAISIGIGATADSNYYAVALIDDVERRLRAKIDSNSEVLNGY